MQTVIDQNKHRMGWVCSITIFEKLFLFNRIFDYKILKGWRDNCKIFKGWINNNNNNKIKKKVNIINIKSIELFSYDEGADLDTVR